MKFAVIEYSSKSGNIWRHTDQRPNYLADPDTEMDPTSFGCYVSAMGGEHIPLTKLIKTNSLTKRIARKLTGHWPQSYPLGYLKQFDALLIVHEIGNGPEITAFTKRLRKTYPHVKLLGVPTQPFGIIKDHWQINPDWLKDFQQFMDTCDVFITIAASTASEWQRLTKTKIVYLPQPYPVEFASRSSKPRSQKKDVLFVAGVTDRDNITKGQAVAAHVQKKLPAYLINVTETPGVSLDIKILAAANYEIIPFKPWQEHLAYLSQVALVINTDYTQTRGRLQADCAAVGTPSVGANSDAQADLFPDLPASKDTPTEVLAQQSIRLLQNDAAYHKVTDTATQQLQKYNYQQSAARLQQLIGSLD